MPEKIKVVAHSGYREEESPRSFVIHGENIEVVEIISTWIEEGVEDKVRKRYFKVTGSDGYTHKLYFDEKAKEWYYA